jgi:hypothetical protein
LKLGLHRLLREASAKQKGLPLLAFIDLNLPAERVNPQGHQWLDETRSQVGAYLAEFSSAPIALVIVLNCPHHYCPAGEPEGLSAGYLCRPVNAIPPLPDLAIANDIEDSLQQHGRIPNFFPDSVPPDIPSIDR